MTMHRSSTVFVIVRAPARRSFFETGRARTASESVAWLTPLFLSTDVNFTEASTSALTASCARSRVSERRRMREEAVSRRVGRDAAGGEPASGRSGRVRRRGRRSPDRAGDDVDSSARPRSRLSERATATRPTSCLVARKSHRGTSSERDDGAAVHGAVRIPTRCANSLASARSLALWHRAKRPLAQRTSSSPSRTLSCDVIIFAGDSYPLHESGRMRAWVQIRPLASAGLFSEERRAPLDERSLLDAQRCRASRAGRVTCSRSRWHRRVRLGGIVGPAPAARKKRHEKVFFRREPLTNL